MFKHINEIIELWKELMDFHKNIDTYWSRREDGHTKYEKFLREMLESEDAIVLVAVGNERIVGYSSSWIRRYPPTLEHDTYGEITDMAVTAEYQRKGIGERMLKRICEWFESRNIDRIELSAAANNQKSYLFWKKHGFQDFLSRLYLENITKDEFIASTCYSIVKV